MVPDGIARFGRVHLGPYPKLSNSVNDLKILRILKISPRGEILKPLKYLAELQCLGYVLRRTPSHGGYI